MCAVYKASKRGKKMEERKEEGKEERAENGLVIARENGNKGREKGKKERVEGLRKCEGWYGAPSFCRHFLQ